MGNFCSGRVQTGFAEPLSKHSSNDDYTRSPGLSAGLFVQENSKSFTEVYRLHDKPLGSGAYGEVWLCNHLITNELRAVKILLKDGMPQEEMDNSSVFVEVEILKSLDHPNILKVFEYFEDPTRYYIVMEFCKGGDVFDKLEKLSKFTEPQAATVIAQLLAGLNYLHGRKIIHRDIKPENLLLCESQNPQELNIKIIDFNVATANKKSNTEVIGTTDYMAPEVFKGRYDEKCDIWGVGVILYMLISGGVPFPGKDDSEIEKKIMKGSFVLEKGLWNGVSADCKDLIKKMMVVAPENRFSAVDALNHAWIQRLTRVEVDDLAYNRTLFRMKTLSKSTKLKEAFTTFMVSQLSSNNSSNKKLEQVFKKIDKNKDGVISLSEIIEELKNEMSQEDAEREGRKIMDMVDVDGSGQVDYTEFLRISIEEEQLLSKENLEKTFRYFDKDGSGVIEKHELMNWLSAGGLSPEVLQELEEEVESSCTDGNINLAGFENLLLKKLELDD